MTHRAQEITRRGLSLVEVAIATVILGVTFAALMVATASSTTVNDAAAKLNQAVFLTEAIREWTMTLPFVDPEDPNNLPGVDAGDVGIDDLDDLTNANFSPPRDGTGSPISDLPAWSQTVTLTWRDPADLGSTVPDGTSDAVYVQTAIACRNENVLTTGWLVMRR